MAEGARTAIGGAHKTLQTDRFNTKSLDGGDMPKGYQVESATLGQTLNMDTCYTIPNYQRPYIWSEEQVMDLWHDLMDVYSNNLNDKNEDYLLGSIVKIQKQNSSSMDVVDGQQRLVTLTLLFCAMRDSLQRYLDDTDNINNEDIKELIEKLNKMIYSDKTNITLNNVSDDTTLHMIYEQKPIRKEKSMRDSQKALIDNYATLLEKIKELYQKCELDSEHVHRGIRKIGDIIQDLKDKIYFVSIVLCNEDYAYPVFQSLNSKGQALNQSDLIKSHLIKYPKCTKRIETLWSKIDAFDDADDFLYYSMLSRTHEGDDVKKHKMFKKIKERCVDSKEVGKYIDELEADHDIVIKLDDPELLDRYGDGQWDDLRHALHGLKHVNALYFRRPIIAACREWGFKDPKVKKLVEFLLIFFFMYRTVCKRDIDLLKANSKTITNQIANNEPVNAIFKTMLKDNMLEYVQDDFQKQFKDSVLKLKRDVALYILMSLERSLQTSGTLAYSHINELELEHIFPQRPSINNWPNMEKLSPHKCRLGNLTLITKDWNKSLKNSDFMTKKNGKDNKGKCYSRESGIRLHQYLSKYHEWTVSKIERYENDLIKKGFKIWDLRKYSKTEGICTSVNHQPQ